MTRAIACGLLFAAAMAHAQSNVVRFHRSSFVRGLHELEAPPLMAFCRATSQVPERVCIPEYFALEQPRRRIRLHAYGLDRYEVSNRRYDTCVAAGRCVPSRTTPGDARIGEPSMPVVNVTWSEAQRYCEWVGGRLPTESEWERAARGVSGRRFPWGQIYNDRLANHGRDGQIDARDGYAYAAPVGAFPDGATRDGVHDLAGNVREWTADAWTDNSDWQGGLAVNPQGDAGSGVRICRGGSWRSSPVQLRGGSREPVPEGLFAPDLGFRCAYD